jgi:hypothetical protein
MACDRGWAVNNTVTPPAKCILTGISMLTAWGLKEYDLRDKNHIDTFHS